MKTYVYKYTEKDGTFLGYHIDSFCQRHMDIKHAKRYEITTTTPESQLEIIQKNFNALYSGKVRPENSDNKPLNTINFVINRTIEKTNLVDDKYPIEDVIISFEEIVTESINSVDEAK